MNAFKRVRNGSESSTYTVRFQFDGEEHTIKTAFTRHEEALRWGRQFLDELKRAKLPSILAEIRARRERTVADIIRAFLEAGCPNAAMQPRVGRSLLEHRRRLEASLPWWGEKMPDAITPADHDDYWVWRRGTVTKGSGDRTVELELQTLSDALGWAMRRRMITTNPLATRRSYRDTKAIVHAREHMPASSDEFHAIARDLLSDPRSASLGWAFLLAGLTGLRWDELKRLRDMPAGAGDPGACDDRFLYVGRAKGGKNPRVRLDDPDRPYTRPVLEAIRAWKRDRYPVSPWLIPGRSGAQLSSGALTHALRRVCANLGLGKRTAHGLRAYYATCRWAQGIEPEQIAHELGQRSGADLVRQVYGGAPPQWDGDLNNKSWLPTTGEPAWAQHLPPGNVVAMNQ